jgi:hypothetical protein
MLTHPDGDHYNLIDALIRQQQVDVDAIFIGGEIEDYNDIADWLFAKQRELRAASGNDELEITLSSPFYSDVPVPALSYDPMDEADAVQTRNLATNVGRNPNDKSIGLAITYRGVCIFLMGNATKKSEDAIFEAFYRDNSWLNETLDDNTQAVLKAGHHGSNTFSTHVGSVSSGPTWPSSVPTPRNSASMGRASRARRSWTASSPAEES